MYYIFCDGANESDKPISGVTEESIQFVLVRKSGYASIGPFNDIEKLVHEVTEQCDYMLQKQSIRKSEAKLMITVASDVVVAMEGNSDKSYTYYQAPYIFEIRQNLNENERKSYPDKKNIMLTNKTSTTVFFDVSCKEYAKDEKVLATLKTLMEKFADNTLPIENPLVCRKGIYRG